MAVAAVVAVVEAVVAVVGAVVAMITVLYRHALSTFAHTLKEALEDTEMWLTESVDICSIKLLHYKNTYSKSGILI